MRESNLYSPSCRAQVCVTFCMNGTAAREFLGLHPFFAPKNGWNIKQKFGLFFFDTFPSSKSSFAVCEVCSDPEPSCLAESCAGSSDALYCASVQSAKSLILYGLPPPETLKALWDKGFDSFFVIKVSYRF